MATLGSAIKEDAETEGEDEENYATHDATCNHCNIELIGGGPHW